MKPSGQTERMKMLLAKKEGTTAAEIARFLPTTSAHSKLARMTRLHGWTITKRDNPDGTKQYFGKAPKGTK